VLEYYIQGNYLAFNNTGANYQAYVQIFAYTDRYLFRSSKDHCVPGGHFDHTNHYGLNMAKGFLNENADEGTGALEDGGLK
jgi:hypothetical protein